MIASNEMDAFVRDGLRRYADAADAVDAYESEIRERLLSAFEQKKDWKNFRARRGDRGRGKALPYGVLNGAFGRMIWTNQTSEDPEAGWIDLGLWWRSPRARDGVVAYCGRTAPNWRPLNVSLADPVQPVVCGPIDQNKRKLYVVLSTEHDVSEIARLLLDEMDRALAIKDPEGG